MARQWETDLAEWSAGWDEILEDAAQHSVQAWDGTVPAGDGVVLVCAPEQLDEVREALAAAGRTVTATDALLSGGVEELDRGLSFPGDAGMFDAPMGGYSRFEVDEWGRPVAHSTLSVQGDVAFMGPLVADQDQERDPAEVLDPLVSSMANEAFLADAQRLYTVVPEAEVPGRASQGWERVAAVLRLG
ncbi:hypothetical protein KVA01_03610 [Kocuria varians]|uniref:Uncharacterized protein n=1 Tax=Kocuria varians TaxID=1272 RepID=A0A4Y4D0U0_KOCVA|nr:hypothetical protein [Kocuria varians]GEC98206.1 hypothetical protein KVA01_03610 [Kocuria varians]